MITKLVTKSNLHLILSLCSSFDLNIIKQIDIPTTDSTNKIVLAQNDNIHIIQGKGKNIRNHKSILIA